MAQMSSAAHRRVRRIPERPPGERRRNDNKEDHQHQHQTSGHRFHDEMRRQQLHDGADLAQLPHVVRQAEARKRGRQRADRQADQRGRKKRGQQESPQ